MWWFEDKGTQRVQNTVMLKYVLPIFILSIFFFAILLWEITFLQFLAITVTWSLMLYTFINIFIQTTHVQIPGYYSKISKTIMYIFHFVLSFMLFYLVIVGILQHHYEFFKKLACCDIIKNFPLF